MTDNNSNDCNDYDSGCKYFHHEPYMTPNNYDIRLDPNEIPSNLECESAYDLEKRLQKLMPLTKKVHLDLGSSDLQTYDSVDIFCSLRLNGEEVKFI